jgi:hypothetical protein
VFLGDGEVEFFLNLNPKEAVGHFAWKDEEYGEAAIAELAKVLGPKD